MVAVKRTKYLLRVAARLIHSSSGYGAPTHNRIAFTHGESSFLAARIKAAAADPRRSSARETLAEN